ALLFRPLFLNNKKLSGTATERLLSKGMILVFILALLALIGGIFLYWNDSETDKILKEKKHSVTQQSSGKKTADATVNQATTTYEGEKLEPPAQVKDSTVEFQSESTAVFQDNFEEGLKKWNVKRYSGYNNFMRWHISENEHFSGKSSLALGHEDTDQKENNDTVHIETREELLLTKHSVLSLKIKKEHRINLEIVLKKDDATFKQKVKFYPGNSEYKDWRVEEIPLGADIDAGRYTLMLKAWDQGRLYLDDIKIEN
ncbi:hypothetical protein VU04_03130, partial [Desulfobulbus sp. TB]|nr:hypothetical protein [Desulfobulbus sp. TB]